MTLTHVTKSFGITFLCDLRTVCIYTHFLKGQSHLLLILYVLCQTLECLNVIL